MRTNSFLKDSPNFSQSQIRSSNIEFLRILAMLMIVIFHIVRHCIQTQITDADSIARMGNGVFNHPIIYKKLYILYTVMPFGKIGVAIFILISGYFLVKKGNQINIAKTIKKNLLQLGFASLTLVFASTFIYRNVLNGEQYIGMQTITRFNSGSWFVGYYFLIVLLGFLFLNKFLNSLDKNKYLTFLLVFFALSQLTWVGAMAEDLATGIRTLLCGIFLYSLGGFIERFNPFEKFRMWLFFLAITLTYVVIYISCYNNTIQKIEDYIQSGASGTFYHSFIVWSDYSIVVIIVAVAMFEIFRRIKMPNSYVINFIASGTFMVYLLHDNSLAYSIWDLKDWATLLASNPYAFMLELVLWTLATFLIGFIVYVIYIGVVELVRKSKVLALKKRDYWQ